MATYWKSQPRKFCDYCKCWITDNKPSVDFHEKGKKHQENVKRKIDELKHKSLKEAAEKDELDNDMKKLEEAAIAAFKKDLINNPELAAQYGVKIKSDAEEKNEDSETPVVYGPSLPETSEPPDTEEWYEALSDQGYTYYWSTKTGASVWEKPEEYTSLDGTLINTSEDKAETDSSVPPDINTIPLPGESEDKPPVEVPKPEDIPLPSECQPAVVERVVYTQDKPETSRAAYGQWASVVQEPIPEQVDLQLPVQPVENIPLPPPSFSAEESKIKFKEKRVTSLGGNSDGDVVTFKKRKIMNKSRNTRRREEDDND